MNVNTIHYKHELRIIVTSRVIMWSGDAGTEVGGKGKEIWKETNGVTYMYPLPKMNLNFTYYNTC